MTNLQVNEKSGVVRSEESSGCESVSGGVLLHLKSARSYCGSVLDFHAG
jgi:hypothetical protein